MVIYKVNPIVKNLLIPLLLLLTDVKVNRTAGSADECTNALSINLQSLTRIPGILFIEDTVLTNLV
jgi:hypothetical protein